jgi:predicted nucleic acid-binding protein
MPIITTNNPFAVDTNVLIYLHDKSDERKRSIAEGILADNPKIPAQVVSEYLNVTRRLLELPKYDIVMQCASLFKDCEIIPVTYHTLIDATGLINKFNMQIFDSVIVAASLQANCSKLYSEDLQHGLVINNMTIVNPFL